MKIQYFTLEEMVSFGNYLLSDARTQSIMHHPDHDQDQIQESLKHVSHADVCNCFDAQTFE
jgi:hypothetical protein